MAKTEGEVPEFDGAAFDAVDTSDMYVTIGGVPTKWHWTFAGPGHPKTVAQNDRLARDRLRDAREKEQSQTNGRKWKAPEESPDEARARNIGWIVERLLGWSPVKIDGKVLEFSTEAATSWLSDPRKVETLAQALEFLTADNSFTKRSVKA
jgi:hypothetical protein